MKKIKFHVPEKMYQEIEGLKKQGLDFDALIQDSIDNMLKEFEENPKEALRKLKELENRYQAEYGIN